VKKLISLGANVNAVNDVKDSSLHLAAWRDHPEVIQELLSAGADLELKNKDGKTAGDLARGEGCRDMLVPDVKTQIRYADSDEE
jgi:ankyrin repeat protein